MTVLEVGLHHWRIQDFTKGGGGLIHIRPISITSSSSPSASPSSFPDLFSSSTSFLDSGRSLISNFPPLTCHEMAHSSSGSKRSLSITVNRYFSRAI